MAKIEKINISDMPKEAQIAVREYQAEANKRKAEMKQRMEHNPEYQRNKQMTKEQKARRAIELMTKSQKEYLSAKHGREVSHSEAEAAARKIAKQYHGNDY